MVKNKKQLSEMSEMSEESEQGTKSKPKSTAERQPIRRQKLKADPQKYGQHLKKQKEHMQKKRKNMSTLEKLSTNMKESARRKELRAKKKNAAQSENTPSPVGSPVAYAASSCLSRAVNRVKRHLPNSPGKKRAVVKELARKVKLSFKKN